MQVNYAQQLNSIYKQIFLFFWLIIICNVGYSQDSHYYSQQPDSKGNLMGGTGTAGSRGLAAIFYNPGIVALFDESNIGLNGSLYSYDIIKISDKENSNRLEGSNVQVMPSLFAGTFKWKKNDRLTTSYAYLNTGYYSNILSAQNYLEFTENGTEHFSLDRYDIRTKYHEDWVGSGISYRINEHWGIGVVPFLHFYTVQYMQRSFANVGAKDQGSDFKSGKEDFREARLFSPALVFNVGIVYSKGNHEFGLTVISPRINLTYFAYSTVERTTSEYQNNNEVSKSVFIDPDFRAYLKRPLELNFGYSYTKSNKSISFRLSYYTGYDSYKMGFESNESIRNGIFKNADQFGFLPVSSNSNTLNLGVGFYHNLRPDFKLVGGFRTDFTFFNRGLYNFYDFTTVLVHWNLYHFSLGVDWQYKWLNLNTGVDYAMSYDKNISQFIETEDLLKPYTEMRLADDARVAYNQIKLFLGLVLSIN